MNVNENRIPKMLTIKATAEMFGLPEHFVRTEANSGGVIGVRSGNKTYINADKFIEYLNTNTLVPIESEPKAKAEPKREKVLGISPIRK